MDSLLMWICESVHAGARARGLPLRVASSRRARWQPDSESTVTRLSLGSMTPPMILPQMLHAVPRAERDGHPRSEWGSNGPRDLWGVRGGARASGHGARRCPGGVRAGWPWTACAHGHGHVPRGTSHGGTDDGTLTVTTGACSCCLRPKVPGSQFVVSGLSALTGLAVCCLSLVTVCR